MVLVYKDNVGLVIVSSNAPVRIYILLAGALRCQVILDYQLKEAHHSFTIMIHRTVLMTINLHLK